MPARQGEQKCFSHLKIKAILKTDLKQIITSHQSGPELVMPEDEPFVIMVVGVNGVGKTTTIGKIARKFQNTGQSVMLVAADTFRAAAASQLKIWGERNKIRVVAQHDGADPSSVVYDGLAVAKSKNYDVVLVDTAGRLHTKANLMEELKKIKRVMQKQLEGSPHEILLVADALTGQDAVHTAENFDGRIGITGVVLTRMDGDGRGGAALSMRAVTGKPIKFVGLGEKMDARGWHLDRNQFPSALHMMVTPAHAEVTDELIAALGAAMQETRELPAGSAEGMAALYGAAAVMPDRGAVNDFAIGFMDQLYTIS